MGRRRVERDAPASLSPSGAMRLLAALGLLALTAAPAPRASIPARTLVITAHDYAFDLPDTVAAGRTEIRLLNRGSELHHVSLVRLDAGHSLRDLLGALQAGGAPPAWAHDAGGPNAAIPSGSTAAVVDLAPATYAVLCFIPGPDGRPHMTKGMARSFVVVAASRAKSEMVDVAAPDVTVTLRDYGFQLSAPLTAGHHVLRFANAGPQTHEAVLVRLPPGRTAQDVVAWVDKMQGPPPAEPLGGVSGEAKGVVSDVPVDLTPGRYALICFVPDATDGQEHAKHGMTLEFDVK